MTKDQILSLLRSLFLVVGAFFAGRMIFGTQLDDTLWQGIVGSVVGLAAAIWAILDKTATIEMLQSALKSIAIVVCGFLITTGKLNEAQLNSILALIPILTTMLYGWLSTQKSKDIATGKLGLADLNGVNEKKPELINPVTNTPAKNP